MISLKENLPQVPTKPPTNLGWCCNVLQDEGFWYTKRFPEDGLKRLVKNTGDVRFL